MKQVVEEVRAEHAGATRELPRHGALLRRLLSIGHDPALAA
jgi:hypothetical protein